MKVISFYIFLFSLAVIYNQEYIEDFCSSKSVSKSIDESDNFAKDVTLANNKVASCISLRAYYEDEDANVFQKCCYTTISYKLKGTKYTRKGCEIIESRKNIDPQIDNYEENFKSTVRAYYNELGQANVEIKNVDANIDCNSNFIKFSVLLTLFYYLIN